MRSVKRRMSEVADGIVKGIFSPTHHESRFEKEHELCESRTKLRTKVNRGSIPERALTPQENQLVLMLRQDEPSHTNN